MYRQNRTEKCLGTENASAYDKSLPFRGFEPLLDSTATNRTAVITSKTNKMPFMMCFCLLPRLRNCQTDQLFKGFSFFINWSIRFSAYSSVCCLSNRVLCSPSPVTLNVQNRCYQKCPPKKSIDPFIVFSTLNMVNIILRWCKIDVQINFVNNKVCRTAEPSYLKRENEKQS